MLSKFHYSWGKYIVLVVGPINEKTRARNTALLIYFIVRCRKVTNEFCKHTFYTVFDILCSPDFSKKISNKFLSKLVLFIILLQCGVLCSKKCIPHPTTQYSFQLYKSWNNNLIRQTKWANKTMLSNIYNNIHTAFWKSE